MATSRNFVLVNVIVIVILVGILVGIYTLPAFNDNQILERMSRVEEDLGGWKEWVGAQMEESQGVIEALPEQFGVFSNAVHVLTEGQERLKDSLAKYAKRVASLEEAVVGQSEAPRHTLDSPIADLLAPFTLSYISPIELVPSMKGLDNDVDYTQINRSDFEDFLGLLHASAVLGEKASDVPPALRAKLHEAFTIYQENMKVLLVVEDLAYARRMQQANREQDYIDVPLDALDEESGETSMILRGDRGPGTSITTPVKKLNVSRTYYFPYEENYELNELRKGCTYAKWHLLRDIDRAINHYSSGSE